MRKTRAAIFGLLFLVSMLSVKIVYADDNASVIYGSRYNQGEPSISYAEDTCDMIMYIFANHANRYGLLRNDFGDPTNRDGILNMIGACENMRDYLAIFHYGHYANTFQIGWWKSYDGYEQYPVSVMHYAYFDDDGILVDDYAIFPLTDDEKPCFIFLWTCVNAEFYDYYDADDYETYPNYYYEGTGAVGMPLAFTHQSSPISFDGYRYPDSGSPYCFIGFNGTSKWLNATCEGTNNSYGDFAVGFYLHALDDGRPINYALDDVCADIWGPTTTFLNSPIRNYLGEDMQGYLTVPSGLHVWGNGLNYIPH